MRGIVIGLGMVVVTLVGLVGGVAAQESAGTGGVVGQRVRARQCSEMGCTRVVGTLLASDPRGLRIAVSADSVVEVPAATLERLEQSMGRRGHAVRGGLIGAGVGLAVGLAGFAAVTSQSNVRCTEDLDCGAWAVIAGGGGAVVGGLIGLGVGALWKTEHWAEAPVSRLTVTPIVGVDRAGLALRVAF